MAKGFIAAMAEHFKRDGQTLGDFQKELKALDSADRKWYWEAFKSSGHDVLEPVYAPQ